MGLIQPKNQSSSGQFVNPKKSDDPKTSENQ